MKVKLRIEKRDLLWRKISGEIEIEAGDETKLEDLVKAANEITMHVS